MTEPMRANSGNYTYADIVVSPEGERWELIDGIAYDMSPTPPVIHQLILGNLLLQFYPVMEKTACKVYIGPLDVRLPIAGEDGMTASTVLQPDLLVVCDREKLDERGCVGSPTLVVEILAPHTVKKDTGEKLHKYEEVGVPEYWIIYPAEQILQVFLRDEGGRYGAPVFYTRDEQAPVAVLLGLTIDLTRVFS